MRHDFQSYLSPPGKSLDERYARLKPAPVAMLFDETKKEWKNAPVVYADPWERARLRAGK